MKDGTEIASPFIEEVEEKGATKKRAELMQKTGKELAKMAKPFTSLSETTLSKLSKAELCDIIISKGKDRKEKPKNKDSSTAIVDTFLGIVESIKVNRDKEPLNNTAKQIFSSNAVAVVDKQIQEEKITSGGLNTAILLLSGSFLLIDGIIGIKNIPAIYKRIKDKISARKTK